MSNRVKVKNDGNQAEVIDALLAAGHAVQVLNQGMGCPDLLVCRKGDCVLFLIEVKEPGKKLTEWQEKFAKRWPGRIIVAHTGAEALEGMR